MKKHIIYSSLAAMAGLFAGYLIFSSKTDTIIRDHDHTAAATVQQLWTCAMHPQVMQPESGACPICGMDLIPAVAENDGLRAEQFKMTENAMALANIQTTVVKSGQTDGNLLRLSGKIRENEAANAVQVTHFSGRIEKLYVNVTGEKVTKGQRLATVYSPELISAQQELLTASTLKTSQPELYKAVRNKLKLWKLSERQIDQIEASGKVKENFPVYATVSGTVTAKMVEEGAYIKQGQPLYNITDLRTVWAVFDAYENQIASLKKIQELTITTQAYPGKTFRAKISFIDPLLNSSTRTVEVRALLNNKNAIFKPGMFVSGSMEGVTSETTGTVIIPASAVLWTGERSVVYVKTHPGEPVFEMREIVLGNYNGDSYMVVSGLSDGEEVVTNSTFTVDATAQLQGKKSMMNKTGHDVATGHQGHMGMPQESPKHPDKHLDHSEKNKRIEIPEAFQRQFQAILDRYMALKDVLVQDSPEKAQEFAKALMGNVNTTAMDSGADEAVQQHWMSLKKALIHPANAIAGTLAIEEQRKHFMALSNQLIHAVEVFGVHRKVYRQFCPMANNNKGAYWLSFEEKIRNPYFGAAMLHCGEA
ncbi:MAG: efflux RND transporter periplasmic adaptor subunit, partial [Bacteroidota bacterium]